LQSRLSSVESSNALAGSQGKSVGNAGNLLILAMPLRVLWLDCEFLCLNINLLFTTVTINYQPLFFIGPNGLFNRSFAKGSVPESSYQHAVNATPKLLFYLLDSMHNHVFDHQ
jgi:hypothetical protein